MDIKLGSNTLAKELASYLFNFKQHARGRLGTRRLVNADIDRRVVSKGVLGEH